MEGGLIMRISFKAGDGTNLLFDNEIYRIVSIGGLGGVDAENQFQKAPYRDGSRYIDSIMTERVIPIELKIFADNEVEMSQRRRFISRVFNPKQGLGVFQVIIGDETFTIEAVSDFTPQFPGGAENMTSFRQVCSIQLTAPRPNWVGPTQYSRALRSFIGKFKLPFSFPVEFGIEGDSTVIENTGDTYTPITIDIQGPVSGPQIINVTTGEKIKVERTLSAEEVMHIETDPNAIRVEVYKEGIPVQKAIGSLSSDSEFIQLPPGKSEFRYIADSGVTDAIVSISWQNQYIGI